MILSVQWSRERIQTRRMFVKGILHATYLQRIVKGPGPVTCLVHFTFTAVICVCVSDGLLQWVLYSQLKRKNPNGNKFD